MRAQQKSAATMEVHLSRRSGVAIRSMVGLLLLASLVQSTVLADEPVGVAELIDQRLEWMDEVAAHKWRNDLAIEDLAREQVVVDRSTADALRYGFTVSSSAAFFRAQIEAAKAIQRHWFDRWARGEPVPQHVPDLVDEVRPQLLDLGAAILTAASRELASDRPGFLAEIEVVGLDEDGEMTLYAAFEALSRYPNRLAQILDSGLLRVGTTGDYAPFSFRADGDTDFRGFDIDMARDLAQALGVELRWVETSWPTLMDDLLAGHYDIAMSGVSIALERQKYGFFSTPYHTGGKAPLTRCDQRERYDTLEEINHPDVRVIVNPGGTNERFVDSTLLRARKLLHEDNRTIFGRIVEREADVMMTDLIEAQWQSARSDVLCVANPKPFTFQQKGYLLPQDSVWKAFVDAWLAQRVGDGTVAALFAKVMAADH